MKTNLKKAQDFAIGQCLSDWPQSASYKKIIELLKKDSRSVTPWEPLEYCDVAHVMENMVSAVTRLLDAQDAENKQ
jgi:hypothetical protein